MLDLWIERMNFRGEGLGVSADGQRFRVANALKDERVTALDASCLRKKLAYLVEVKEASVSACSPVCPHWRDCAACQYARVALSDQEVLKRDQWLRVIGRFVSLDAVDVSFRSSAVPVAYRQRARASFADGHFVMPIRLDAQNVLGQEDEGIGLNIERAICLKECRLHASSLNEAMARLEAYLADRSDAAFFEYDVEAFESNVRLTLYAPPDLVEKARVLAQQLAKTVENTCDAGMSIVLQPVPPRGSHVYPPAESFGQSPWYAYTRDLNGDLLYSLKGAWTPVNPLNAARIREILCEFVRQIDQPVQRVLELGCGCGTHTTVFDPLGCAYHGIDASWPAIQSAQFNAQQHGWNGKTFQTSTAQHYLDKNYYKGHRADLVLMHSNRLPYGADVANYCQKFGAHTIFVVAPTAYAMAAECQHFVALGYRLQDLVLCDTLPYTYHMMAVARLVRPR